MNLEEQLTVRLEMDEMWGRVYCKETPCWLWHAINHENGELIAYVLGSREHGMLQQLLELLNGLNLGCVLKKRIHKFKHINEQADHNFMHVKRF